MDLEDKLSAVSGIPEYAITKFEKYIDCVHGDDIVQSMLANKTVYEVTLFEGTVYVTVDDDDMVEYKFVPNAKFESVVSKAITSKTSPVLKALNDKIVKLFSNIYNDIL